MSGLERAPGPYDILDARAARSPRVIAPSVRPSAGDHRRRRAEDVLHVRRRDPGTIVVLTGRRRRAGPTLRYRVHVRRSGTSCSGSTSGTCDPRRGRRHRGRAAHADGRTAGSCAPGRTPSRSSSRLSAASAHAGRGRSARGWRRRRRRRPGRAGPTGSTAPSSPTAAGTPHRCAGTASGRGRIGRRSGEVAVVADAHRREHDGALGPEGADVAGEPVAPEACGGCARRSSSRSSSRWP